MSADEGGGKTAFGPYIVDSTVGRGGMGVVYRAHHRTSGAAVALKTVRVRSPQLLALFRREVHVLANVRHPGVVRIIEHGLTSDTPWYAMELVEGLTLSAWLGGARGSTAAFASDQDRSPLASKNVTNRVLVSTSQARALPSGEQRDALLRIFRKICHVLGFVHAHGLVHKDLKPDNVLIRDDGSPVLVDFGLAASVGGTAGRETLEFTDSFGGTFAYMAPEQRAGRFVDARADLFSLGCMLYEALSGSLPFGASGLFATAQRAPTSLHECAAEVSAELSQLVARMLTYHPRDRFGYASDVDAVLARALRQPQAGDGDSRTVAYAYRSELTGRSAPLDRLLGALSELRDGQGRKALVAGESGVGKTRLMLELAARATEQEIQVITGECQPAGLDGEALGVPLHPFRGFLQAIADRCREGGAERTRRLLGARARVLAPYQPALLELCGDFPEPQTLPAEAARKRLFEAFRAVLEEATRERPLLIILDDLQWADELTLELLRWLEPGESGLPVLLVGTCRLEEMGDKLGALSQVPSVLYEELGRLDSNAVELMVAGMLALQSPPRNLTAFLLDESRGNPFFVSEYLRVAIAEGLLDRDAEGRWVLRSRELTPAEVALPATIGALIDRRLSGLPQSCVRALEAAAVLGRGFDVELVARTAEVDVAQVLDAYSQLRQRQILEEDGAGSSRFVHDKLRELAYARIPQPLLGAYHERAGVALESRAEGGKLETPWGALGYHFGRARQSRKSAQYFERAADQAREAHANADAGRSLRQALEQVALTEPEGGEQTARLHEALGDVLLLDGQAPPARLAFEAALTVTPANASLTQVRRHRKLARTWEREHHHAEALAEYARAEDYLSRADDSARSTTEYWHESVQIQVDKAWDLYWLAKLDELSELVERVRPLVQARGTPQQRAQFFQALVHTNLRRDRYGIAPDTVEHARASLAAAELADDPSQLALARFFLAFPLMFRGNEAEAEPLFLATLTDAERIGDATLLARALSYYTILHRRLGRVVDAKATAERALKVAERGKMLDYIGAAHANLCWAAWRERRLEAVATHAEQAFAAWSQLPSAYPYPFQWYLRLPFAAYLVGAQRVDEAAEQFEFSLRPGQQALPDELCVGIRELLAAREAGASSDETTRAARVVELAEELRYL